MLTANQIATIKSRAAARAHEHQPPKFTRLEEFRPHEQADIRPPSLWHPYIPRAGITLLAAPPGAGKSSIALDLAARASQGLPMPDGTIAPETPGCVLLIAPEDPRHLVAQRLQRLGAHPERIHFHRQFPGDEIESLDELIVNIPADVALVIIDPVTSFLRDLTAGKLWEFAFASEDYNVPVLLTVPLRRPAYSSADLPFSLRALASYPRSILSIVPASAIANFETRNPKLETRLLLPLKTNAAALPPPVPFTLGQTLQWHPSSPDHPAPEPPLDPALQEAVNFLQNLLQNGPQPATAVLQSATQNLITRGTLYRAKHHLQIQSERTAMDSPWFWTLDSNSPERPAPKSPES